MVLRKQALCIRLRRHLQGTLATLFLSLMQKQRTATAVSTETVEADSELGAPKFLPFVQQVKHGQAQH